MTNPKKLEANNPERRAMANKITESLLEMPGHYRTVVMVFLESVLDGNEDAVKLSEDYNAGKMTTVELWEELQRRFGGKDSVELIA